MAFFSRPSQSIYCTTAWVSIFLPTPHISPWTAWLTNDWLLQNIEAKELGNPQATCWYRMHMLNSILRIPVYSKLVWLLPDVIFNPVNYVHLHYVFHFLLPLILRSLIEEIVFILLYFFFLTDSCDPRSVNLLIAEKCYAINITCLYLSGCFYWSAYIIRKQLACFSNEGFSIWGMFLMTLGLSVVLP